MARALKVGLLVAGGTADETVEVAQICERYGLDSIWIVEDPWNRGAVPLAAACAMRTKQLRIGVGVTNVSMRHPALFAMDYGALAELSRGRVVLGIGSCIQACARQMGLECRLPRTSVKEAIDISRSLLGGETSSYSGQAFATKNAKLSFPVTHATPIYMGAMGERTVRTCGEIADGWIVSILEPLGFVRQAMTWLGEGAAGAGRDPDELEVVQYFLFSCAENSSEAKRAVKPLLALLLISEFRLFEQEEVVLKAFRDHVDTITSDEYVAIVHDLASGADPTRAIPDAFVDELAIAGTAAECSAKLAQYEEAGVTEAALLPVGDLDEAAALIGSTIRS